MDSFKVGKLIGKGAFSKVYELGERHVLIHSRDMQKAFISEQGQGMFKMPEMELVRDDSELPYKEGYRWYVSPRYRKVRAFTKELKPEDVALYRQLREIQTKWWSGYSQIKGAFNAAGLFKLADVVEELANYINTDHLRFEISPRNIALDANGDLVLLDCFYCIEALNQGKG